MEGDLLLYQGGAPPPVKNLRPPLQRQLHSFFFVFEHNMFHHSEMAIYFNILTIFKGVPVFHNIQTTGIKPN